MVETPMVRTKKIEELETSSEERRGNAFDPIVVSTQTGTRHLFPPRLGEIVKSSMFGNDGRRISKVVWAKEISCNSRIVIYAQWTFAKDRRMRCSRSLCSSQE